MHETKPNTLFIHILTRTENLLNLETREKQMYVIWRQNNLEKQIHTGERASSTFVMN